MNPINSLKRGEVWLANLNPTQGSEQAYRVHKSPNQLPNNESSPPNPPSLGGTRFQSPPVLGDLGGKNLENKTQTYVCTVVEQAR